MKRRLPAGLLCLLLGLTACGRREPDLAPIVTEPAGAYFAGDKSLAETARLIQNRASLYVNESR